MDIFTKPNTTNSLLCFLVFLTFLFSSQAHSANNKSDSEALGIAFTHAAVNRDTNAMAKLFDLDAFAEKTANLAFTKQKDISDFKGGFLSNFETQAVFMDQIMNELFKEQFGAKYLRVVDGRPLIRFDYDSGGYEYMFLLPKQGATKTVLAEDLFFLTNGKEYSKVIAGIVQMSINPSESILKRLFDIKDINTDITKSISQIIKLVSENNYQQAYDQLEALPEGVKTSRYMIDIGVQVSGAISDELYEKQLSRLEKHYGNDPSTSFSLIDYHFLKKDYAKAIKTVGVLQRNLGNDGALESMVASIHFEAGDMVLAKQHALKAIDIEADFENSYWTLVGITNATKSYGETVATLSQLENIFGYEFTIESISAEPSYADLIKSQAFKDWIRQ